MPNAAVNFITNYVDMLRGRVNMPLVDSYQLAQRFIHTRIPAIVDYLKNLMLLTGFEEDTHDIMSYEKIIRDANKTKRHPIYIIGINGGCKPSESEEVKLYYSFYSFDACDNLYGDNDFEISLEAAQGLLGQIDDAALSRVFPSLKTLFGSQDTILALFGLNRRKDKRRVHKLYFTDGCEPINNRMKFLSDLHKILFGNEMNETNKELLASALTYGFSPAEMCIASDGENLMMKIYFSTAYQ